jgi:methylamine dehydrogenase accessory protein MauD
MDIVVLFARLLLAVVFAVAGVAKLADREGSRQAVAGFGVPAALAAPLGILLPFAELAVAIALIPTATAFWGALGALVLLLLFVAGIGANLARGRRPDCHCFGQLHSAPAGWATLARNGALAAVAAFLVWRGLEGEVGPSVVGWIGALSATQLLVLACAMILLALVAAQWWFLLVLLRQNGRLLARLNAVEERLATAGVAPSENGGMTPGLPVGTPAPAFALKDLDGEEVTLDGLRARGKPVMLLFTDPNCGPCSELLPEVGHWQQHHAEKLTISLVGRGSAEENRADASEHGVENVLLQEDWEVADDYEIDATPSAVVVDPEGTIESPVAEGPDEVEALVAQAVGERAQLPLLRPTADTARDEEEEDVPEGPKVGEPAPEIGLPDLKGNHVGLEDIRGEETLLLFWSPWCGFCQEMLPDLKEWEAAPPEGAPKLLIVSDGTVEENEAMGFSSPVVLDNTYAVGDAYGVSGTPSAVLVDAEGRIASEVVVGASEVLELVRSGRNAAARESGFWARSLGRITGRGRQP